MDASESDGKKRIALEFAGLTATWICSTPAVNCARWRGLRRHLARDLEVIAQGILQVEKAFIM